MALLIMTSGQRESLTRVPPFEVYNLKGRSIVDEHLGHIKNTIKKFEYSNMDVVRKINITDPNAKLSHE